MSFLEIDPLNPRRRRKKFMGIDYLDCYDQCAYLDDDFDGFALFLFYNMPQ